MPIASSSLTQIGYIQEQTFGVLPATGNYKKLRVTGESLDYSIEKVVSDELNNTRSSSSMIPVRASTGGGLESEVSYAEYDPLLQATLQGTWSVFGTNGVGATFTATFTATTITASAATTGTSLFTLLQKGQFFRLNAPTHANDGKICRVSLTVAPTATVLTLEASTPLAVGAAIANCTIASSRLTNGATQRSFAIERQNADIGEYWAYLGQTFAGMDFKVSKGSKSSFSFKLMGKKPVRGTTTNLPGTPTESQTYDIHSGSSGAVGYMWVDGAPLVGTFVQEATVSYDNALRTQEDAFSLGAIGVGSGTIAATGKLDVYFANGALFDKYVANTSISVVMSTVDSAGNGYIISMPKCNLGKVGTTAGSKDQDMMLSIEYTALRDAANADPALRQVIFIDRIGAAVT